MKGSIPYAYFLRCATCGLMRTWELLEISKIYPECPRCGRDFITGEEIVRERRDG